VQRALRDLAAEPGTDFAALPADEFFAVLKYACQDGAVSPVLMAEAGRRIAAGESGPRELHQVLLVSGDHEAWAEVRGLAMETAVQAPAMAVSVVGLEAQRLGLAGMDVAESATDGRFTAEAALELDGGTRVAGSGHGGSKLEELMDAVTAAGDAALIFTGYVAMGHLIQAHLDTRGLPAEFLHGGTPPARRQEIVDRFLPGRRSRRPAGRRGARGAKAPCPRNR
jgi:hypothetical protein